MQAGSLASFIGQLRKWMDGKVLRIVTVDETLMGCEWGNS
jgi:hypothetical protein